METLEPIALGELGLTIEQFGSYTVGQISALTSAYVRRRDALEDLFIQWSALPVYQTQCKKAPTFEKLTAHRKKRQKAVGDLSQEDVEFWRSVIEEATYSE